MEYGKLMPIRWSGEQTNLLLRLFNEGKDIDEIADRLNDFIRSSSGYRTKVTRSPKAIMAKLFRLGAISGDSLRKWEEELGKKTEKQRKDKRWGTKQKILKRDGNECVVCGDKKNLQFAHVVPFRKTKINAEEEAVTLCPRDHALFDEKNGFEARKIYDYMCKKYGDYWKRYELKEEYNQLTNKDKVWIERK